MPQEWTSDSTTQIHAEVTDPAATLIREKGVRKAIASSLVSKGVTLSVQFVTMPLLYRALGTQHFALYSLLVAGSTWLTLANLGMGPALVSHIAATNASGDKARQAQVFTSAFLPVLIVVSVVALASLVLVDLLPAQTFVGRELSAHTDTVTHGLALLVLLCCTQSVLSVVESVQAGFQEQYASNLWIAAGGALSIPCLLASAVWYPTVLMTLITLNLPPLAGRIMNSFQVLIRRPHLLPRFRHLDWTLTRRLAIDGTAFSLVALGAFFNHQFPIVLAGRTMSADVTATVAATMSGLLLCFGLISMLAIPLWPAIADSVARRDFDWVLTSVRRLRNIGLLYGILVALAFWVAGGYVFRILYGTGISPSKTLMATAGLYFFLAVWEHIHYYMLVGLSGIFEASLLYILRSALVLLLLPSFLASHQGVGIFLCGIISCLLVTFISYPWLIHRRLTALRSPGSSIHFSSF